MPGGLALHEGHALALDRVGEDHGRHALAGHGRIERGIQRREIVPVAAQHVPAEGLPFAGQVTQRHDLIGRAVKLDLVPVHDGGEVIQAELHGRSGRLPDGALIELAVAEHGVHARIGMIQLQADGDALRSGQADAQRAGRHVHTRRAHARVALQGAAGPAQGVHALGGQEALADQVAVEHGRGVALAEHEPVTVRIVGVRGVHMHALLIQQREDLTNGQAAARVAGLRAVDGGEYVDPILTAKLLKLGRAFRGQRHGGLSSCLMLPN